MVAAAETIRRASTPVRLSEAGLLRGRSLAGMVKSQEILRHRCGRPAGSYVATCCQGGSANCSTGKAAWHAGSVSLAAPGNVPSGSEPLHGSVPEKGPQDQRRDLAAGGRSPNPVRSRPRTAGHRVPARRPEPPSRRLGQCVFAEPHSDLGSEPVRRDRLGQIVVHAQFHAFLAVALERVRGHPDDGNMRAALGFRRRIARAAS